MKIVFVGGGNMASALIGGLVRGGHAPTAIHVIEVEPARREALAARFGVGVAASPGASMSGADATVLAVKPQQLREVAGQCRPWIDRGFVLSIAAGIGSEPIARWCGRESVVRAMPNTPALIGAGISGLYARSAVATGDRALAARILEVSGTVVWFDDESMLDAVTAVSGSGPAYVFYFIEALQAAAEQMGMDAAQARQFAVATFAGASRLAQESTEPVALLRERVTSKGGTTAAALAHLEAARAGQHFIEAAFAALERSRELSRTFGA